MSISSVIKVKILFLIFILCQLSCFSQTIYNISYYKFNYETEKYQESDDLIIQELNINGIRPILDEIEKEYEIKIESEFITYRDKNNNSITGVVINLISSKQLVLYFQALAHRPILIDAINLNLLQVFTAKWPIEFIMYKFNGVFISQIPTEVGLETIYTKSMLDIEFLLGKHYKSNW